MSKTTARRLIDLALFYVVGILAALAVLTRAAHGQGQPTDLTAFLPPGLGVDADAWWTDPALVPVVVLAVYGLIAVASALGRTRWAWTAWLRVGRVQAHLAGAAGALAAVVPGATAGTLRPSMLLASVASWLIARNMPGGGEGRPTASGIVEVPHV